MPSAIPARFQDAGSQAGADFAVLRRRAQEDGLFERKIGYFVYKWTLTGAMVAASLTVLLLTDNIWIQLLNAAFLGFAFTQVALVTHDAGHCQVFARTWKNLLVGYVCSFVMGFSLQWWVQKHNAHHASPNHEDLDPDIDIPFVAFSEDQVRGMGRLQRTFVRYQQWFYIPMLTLTTGIFKSSSIRFMLRPGSSKLVRIDIALFALHLAAYLGLVFWALPWPLAIVFVVVHQMAWGFYMGMIFAPNHKGMPIIPAGQKVGFFHAQVLTSRNIRGGAFVNFLYGGLNYQVEHHLFPTMQRNRLAKANALVKRFCIEHDVPYHETGVLQSLREIFGHLREVGRTPAAA